MTSSFANTEDGNAKPVRRSLGGHVPICTTKSPLRTDCTVRHKAVPTPLTENCVRSVAAVLICGLPLGTDITEAIWAVYRQQVLPVNLPDEKVTAGCNSQGSDWANIQ
jgi:hypothetical protein